MGVFEIEGVIPVVHPTAFVHPDSSLIGDVIVGPECYVGPFASLRGDFGRIELGRGSNVQDSCVLHCFPDMSCIVEEEGHIGHAVVDAHAHALQVQGVGGHRCLRGLGSAHDAGRLQRVDRLVLPAPGLQALRALVCHRQRLHGCTGGA